MYTYGVISYIKAGNNATFEIQLDEKTSSVTWLKDNKPLNDRLADRITTSESDGNYYQLRIKHCCESDTGLYTAKACNSNSDSATCSAQLIVHESKLHTHKMVKNMVNRITNTFVSEFDAREVIYRYRQERLAIFERFVSV